MLATDRHCARARYHRSVPATTALRAAPERALRVLPPVAVAPALPRPAGDAAAGHPLDGRPVRRRRDARRGARRAGAAARPPGSGRPSTSSARRSPRPTPRRPRPTSTSRPSTRWRPAASTATSASSSARWVSASTTDVVPRQRRADPRVGPPSHEAFVRIDMEDHTTTDATLALWRDLRPVNAGRGDSGVVIQAALRRSAGRRRRADRASAPGSGCARAPTSSRPSVAFPDKARRRRGVRDADGAAPARRRPSRDRDPRRAPDRPGRRVRPRATGSRPTGSSSRCCTASGATSRSGSLKAGLRRPGLRPVRHPVVSVLHAPPGRAAGERRVRPAERPARGSRCAVGCAAGPPPSTSRAAEFEEPPDGQDGRLVGCAESAMAVGGPPDESESRGRCGFSASAGRLRAREPSWRAPTGP